MIPNIETGKSFRGAQLYYLHDKREAKEHLRLSDERVMWIETRNTAHDAAEYAFAEMIATARDQDQLKLMSGERLSGRQCEQPVMTISLSWHPSEKPGKEQMIEAADSYLRHMGWEEHQAVYAAHSDTAHPHLHIILNRIHPENGRVLDDSFSRNRSQEWARDYEREHGRIWCEERVGRDYTRADGKEERSLPHDFAIDARDAQQRHAELEEAARTLDRREREQLARHHQDEREAFFDSRHQQFRQAREAAYREVRDEYKDRWVEHFRKAEELREQAERDAADLARQVLQCARQGDFAAAWEMLEERNQTTKTAEQEIAEGRRDLRAEQRIETRKRQDETCAELYDERALAYAHIKLRQKEERDELKELQAARAEREPYDQDRLTELVTEPVPERLVNAAEPISKSQELELQSDDAKPPPELVEDRLAEREEDTGTGRGAAHSDAVADTGEALAGGIGKIAEVLAEALSNIINPPTPRELAIEKARDRARDQAEAERQPVREEDEAKRRYAHHEQQRSATDPFESFFNENADRLRREEEERRQKTKDRDRER